MIPGAEAQAGESAARGGTSTLIVGAVGVVFGDIGTSPLYAFKELFNPEYGIAPTAENILGGLSLFFWSLVFVVSIKYVAFIMRADNRGEGGIMALIALCRQTLRRYPRAGWIFLMLGIFGASLFFGDGVITPAISVLSAVEGVEVLSPGLGHYVVPIALIVLIALFMMQRWGTGNIGGLFGPIMVAWFAVLAMLGLKEIAAVPGVLSALDPRHGLRFFAANHLAGFIALGAVVLAVTGAEALYADMGHFGKRAITMAWTFLVLPALVFNYFGQGALVLSNPAALDNPFYYLAPSWALAPMIVLATIATIIASEAVISGTYSMAREAIQLGYLPRMNVVHTSASTIGQVYMPFVNVVLAVGVAALVLGMQSSTHLAAAYGIAVTGTMAATTLLASLVAYASWKYSLWKVVMIGVVFLVVDLAFLLANLPKIPHGGWITLVIGAVVFTLLSTWKRGRQLLLSHLRTENLLLEPFLKQLLSAPPLRVPGTAVYLNASSELVPHSLLHNLKHNKVLHERLVIMTIVTAEIPNVAEQDRVEIRTLAPNAWQLLVHYGFQDAPNIPRELELCRAQGLAFDLAETSFFLSRETVIPTSLPGMALWRERLFALMYRNSQSAMDYFKIPCNRVVELGAQVEI